MSQSVTTPNGQSFGTVNGGMPKASRVYSFSVTLVPGVTNVVDLRTLMINKMVQDVQGIYLDNSDNTAACTVQTSTGQKITWAGGYQGQTPIYVSSQNPVFYFTGNGTVNISLNNFPTPAQFWSAAGNGLPVVGGKVQVADPILDALVSNNAFVANPTLFGDGDILVPSRAGKPFAGSRSATGLVTIITGSPNSFVTGFCFSSTDATSSNFTLNFSGGPLIFQGIVDSSHPVYLSGLNCVGVGNVTMNVTSIGTNLEYTIFGGSTAL